MPTRVSNVAHYGGGVTYARLDSFGSFSDQAENEQMDRLELLGMKVNLVNNQQQIDLKQWIPHQVRDDKSNAKGFIEDFLR